MRITIREIADMACVHRSTVDKVLHNRPGVSDEVRERVQRILDEFDYQPNQSGVALQRQRKVYRIGVILIDVDAYDFLKEGINKGLREFDDFKVECDIRVVKFADADAMARLIEAMVRDKVDGIILNPINAQSVRDAAALAAQKGIPLVTVNADLENTKRLCCVGHDSFRASHAAGRLMGEMIGGEGRVAIITSAVSSENNNYYIKVRESEFISYMQKTYPKIDIVACIENWEDSKVTTRETLKLLQKEPELKGIYITCGGVAEVGQSLRIAGRAGDVKVIGFERYPKIVELMKEDCITCTIDSQIQKQGKIAVRIMMKYLLYGTRPDEEYYHIKNTIVVKELL